MTNFIKLGDLTTIKTGKLDANASTPDGAYPFFTCAIKPLKIASYSYDCECVLVAGNGDLNVKYYDGKFDAYQRTYIIEVKDKEKLLTKYLYYFLQLYISILRSQSIGGVIKYIKLNNLTDLLINVPHLNEQQRIISRIEQISTLMTKRKQQLEKLDALVKAKFYELFGNIPATKYNSLENVCKTITDGTHQPPQFSESGIPFLFVSNLADNEIDYETQKFISRETYNELIKRTPIEVGDILLTTVGSYGHPAVVEQKREFCFQRHIAYLKPNAHLIDSRFLHGALLSPIGQEQIEKAVKGIAQKTLNLSEIKHIKIPVPSLEQQSKYSNYHKRTEKIKTKIKQSLEKLELLKQSLLQKYFG